MYRHRILGVTLFTGPSVMRQAADQLNSSTLLHAQSRPTYPNLVAFSSSAVFADLPICHQLNKAAMNHGL